MYKVNDSDGNEHWVDADSYQYDTGILGVANFWKDKAQVASFDKPISIELVQEKVIKEKEIVYVPMPYYYYPYFTKPWNYTTYPAITWSQTSSGQNCYGGSIATSGYCQSMG